MNANRRARLLAILWQGALLLVSLIILFAAGYVAVYRLSWGRAPHWIEAFRDRYKLENLAENRRWPWIHQDTQYWIVRVRFDKGPITLEGTPPRARYWSVTYYAAGEQNDSVNNLSVNQDEDGRYHIVFTQDPQPDVPNQILVRPGVKRAVIEMRITLPENEEPILFPSVKQNGTLLIEGTRP